MITPKRFEPSVVAARRYQFQSFAQYRGKLVVKTPEELATLRASDDVWSVLGVLNYLQALVDKSGIVAELSTPGRGRENIVAALFSHLHRRMRAETLNESLLICQPCGMLYYLFRSSRYAQVGPLIG